MGLSSIRKNSAKWFKRHVADSLKNFRRQLRRAAKSPRLALGYQGFRRAVDRHDWRDAHRRLTPLALAAEKAGDPRLLKELAFSAERLDEHEKSTQWQVASARLAVEIASTEWSGEDLSDATLLIRFMESEKQGLAIGLNMAGYVTEAAAKARHCVLVVEHRMVQVFTRTLPDVEVLPFPAQVEARGGTRLVTANPLTLRSVLGSSPDEIEERFRPLKAKDSISTELREGYLAGRAMPLIGVSWWSSHFGKDLPSIDDWAEFVRSTDAVFVSIQYGDVASDLASLKTAAPDRVIVDDTIDQMVDMDRFAAQLGALDAVVTISNTGAHLAGAMGIPTCLIRDDWFRRAWPVLSDRTPWYPKTGVHGKNGRDWESLFNDVKKRLAGWLKAD